MGRGINSIRISALGGRGGQGAGVAAGGWSD